MRAVLDTNVFISALVNPHGAPARIYRAWRDRRAFELLTGAEQFEEFRRVSRYPLLRALFAPHQAGRMLQDLRRLARLVEPTDEINVSRDPGDNFLMAIAVTGDADYLVTGDRRSGLLALRQYRRTRIVTAAQFLAILG